MKQKIPNYTEDFLQRRWKELEVHRENEFSNIDKLPNEESKIEFMESMRDLLLSPQNYISYISKELKWTDRVHITSEVCKLIFEDRDIRLKQYKTLLKLAKRVSPFHNSEGGE